LPEDNAFVPIIVKIGMLMEALVTLRPMEISNCHSNVAALWHNREKEKLLGIGTGYDGLWRGHSWALTKCGIIETTETRISYFGVRLEGEGADLFCWPIKTHQRRSVFDQFYER